MNHLSNKKLKSNENLILAVSEINKVLIFIILVKLM